MRNILDGASYACNSKLWGRSDRAHFAVEEIKAQRAEVTCAGHTNLWWVAKLHLTLGLVSDLDSCSSKRKVPVNEGSFHGPVASRRSPTIVGGRDTDTISHNP